MPSRAFARPPLRSAGSPLDRRTRRLLEPQLGHDLGRVRVHPEEWAVSRIGAAAFAAGPHVAFAPGRYAPETPAGLRLLAHELAHVVQQERRGRHGDPERSAGAVAARVAAGEAVSPADLGSAPPGLYAQEEEERRPTTVEPAFTLPWDVLLRPGAFQLTPPFAGPGSPVLGAPGRFGLGAGTLTAPSLGTLPSLTPPPGLAPGALTPPAAAPSPVLTPPPTTSTAPAAPTSPPSRLSVASTGSFSLGLRLGFPEIEARTIPGAPPPALAESLRRAELMNAMLTGKVPQGWEAVDKAKLARAVWGIFSTHLAPDLARSITSSLSSSTTAAGPSYQLDLVLFTNFSGGGLSFSVQY